MLRLRKIFFYLFVLIYVIFCPILILYALGYIYSPRAEMGIVKSGLIYLSTAPPGATVYLGNRKYTRKTPTILLDILPGDYPLRIVLKKHRSWSQTVPVEAGKATVLERILLLPETLKPAELGTDTFENLIPIPRSKFLILTKGEKAQDLQLFDLRSEELRDLVPLHSAFRNMKLISVSTVPKSSEFMLHLDSEEGEQYVWVEPRWKEIKAKNISGLIPASAEYIEWSIEDKRRLFSLHEGSLSQINLMTKSVKTDLIGNVQGFGVFNQDVYVLQTDYSFRRFNQNGELEKVLLDDPVLGEDLFGKDLFKIEIFQDDLIVFFSEEGRLITNRLPYKFVEKGVLGYQYEPKSQRLLVWKEDAIGIIDFSKAEKAEHSVFEASTPLIWIYKGENIKQAFWVFESSQILFLSDHSVQLLELETYGKPYLQKLLDVKPHSSIHYLDDIGKLYYIDHETQRFSSLEILPRREIILLPFPERKEERKKIQVGSYEFLV